MKYVELMVVADHTEVKSLKFRDLLKKSMVFLGNFERQVKLAFSTMFFFLHY